MQAIELPEAQALLAALPRAAALVRRPEVAAAWGRASDLPGYSVGGVAGHLVRATERMFGTLDGPDPDGDPVGFDAWYLANRMATAADLDEPLARWLVDDGEELAAAGPEPTAAQLGALVATFRDRLAEEPAHRRVSVVRTEHPVPLRDYVASRLVEVVVHADDVATGAGLDDGGLGDDVVAAANAVIIEMAAARSGGRAVLRALTRSDRVADPYDVLRVL